MGKLKKKTVKVPKFNVELYFGNKTYESSGDTIEAALRTLQKPQKILSKGVLTIKSGDRLFTRLYMPVQLRRLFYPLSLPIQAKQLSQAFK